MEISTLIKTALKVIILSAVSPGFTFLIMKIVYTRMSSASVFIEAKRRLGVHDHHYGRHHHHHHHRDRSV